LSFEICKSFPGHQFEKFAEMGAVAKPERIGDLLHGPVSADAQPFGFESYPLSDMISGGASGYLPDDIVQIAGCDHQIAGVMSNHFVRFEFLIKEGHEFSDELKASCLAA
jgi:hypothetical protein